MLVNYCGLNPMGNKTKAGCPVKNIQATLDGLTSAGFSVAVYEEINDVDADRGYISHDLCMIFLYKYSIFSLDKFC